MFKEIIYHMRNPKTGLKAATLVMRREEDSEVVTIGWSQPCKQDNFSCKSGREEAIKKIESKTGTNFVVFNFSDEFAIKDTCKNLTTYLIGERIDVYLEKAKKYFKEATAFHIPINDNSKILEIQID